MEIFRDFARSIGQHMLLNNVRKDLSKPNWKNFANCISPNNLRRFDRTHSFKRKYPLGTIHLLLAIVGSCFEIKIKKEAICPLMYTDGTFKNIFGYPANALDWFSFLCADNRKNPLYEVFLSRAYTTTDLMLALNDIFKIIADIGGDGMVISNSRGEPDNLRFVEKTGLYDVTDEQVCVLKEFLAYLSSATGWKFDDSKWATGGFRISRFIKGQLSNPAKGSGGPSLAAQYDQVLSRNPISWAVTKASQVQYTLERDVLD